MMKISILIYIVLFLNTSHGIAGGWTWTCNSKQFRAQWNGKPFHPLGDLVSLVYLPKDRKFDAELISKENIDGKQFLFLEGEMETTPVQVIIEYAGKMHAKMSIVMDSLLAEENINCSPF